MRPRIPLPAQLRNGPFTTKEAHDFGLHQNRLRGSDLRKPFRGVRVPVAGELDLVTACAALSLRVPADAFFCGQTAARLLGVPLPSWLDRDRRLHLGVFAPATAPVGRGIRGHVLQLEPQCVAFLDGLRVVSPAQAWCELGAILPLPDLIAAGDFLVHHRDPLVSVDELGAAIEGMAGKRGVVPLREAHPLLNDHAESPQESKLRVILLGALIAGLVANYPIRTSGGYDYRGDLVVPKRKLIIEYQSAFHEITERFRADMTRISRLEADGWMVMQFNKDDLANPLELVARVRRALRDRPIFPVEL